jgi:hypothetical protein
MAPLTRSDATALEHILAVLLEQPVLVTGSAAPPFRACFLAAGVTTATDFVSITPDTYGSVEFSIEADGSDASSKLNVIQIKKIRSLIDWFSQVPAPPATRWFDLTDDAFRTWRTQSTLTSPASVPAPAPSSLSAISEFRKGVKRSVSDYKAFKEDRFFISWQRHLQITARSHNVDNVINLTYKATTPDEIALLHEQQKFFFSVLEQTVLTPDGLLIIRNHSATGNATAAYSALVDRYGKSTAAELAATDIENDLIEFRMDASWTKTNSAFLQAWTNKSLDLDAVSAHPILDSQKRLWLTRAVAPKAILSLAISHFDTSEKLASRTQGSAYVKASFSNLYDHVSDVATRHDQADKLLQAGARRANEAKVAAGDIKTPKDKTTFIGKDGDRHSFVIPPDQWKVMTPIQRTTALAKIRADKGLPPKAVWQRRPPADRQVNSSNTSLSDSTQTMTSYVEVANPNSGSSVVSGVTQQSSGEQPASSTPSLRQVLSSSHSPAPSSSTSPGADSIVSIGGRFYRQCNVHSISYNLSNHASSPVLSSLIDGGANGGMAGDDVRVISESSFNQANVTGIGESVIQNLSLATVAGLVTTHRGPAIVLLHQYANYGKGHTIHSSSQLRAFGTLVHDTARSNGGLQRLITPDGYHIPLCYRSGLPYMDMRPPNDHEWDTLPHILLTGDDVWNPSCLDDEFSVADLLLDAPPDTGDQDPRVNDFGQYTGNLESDIDLLINECRAEHTGRVATEDALNVLERRINQRTVSKAAPNLESLRPNFGWLPLERIKKTIQNTTQFARNMPRYPFRKHYRTRWPAANVDRWNEDVATDTFFSDTPAHDDGIMGHSGCTMAQIYAGKRSSKLVAYGMTSETQMPHTLEDLIRKHGAPNCLFSDNAKVQIGSRVRDILRLYKIKDFQCEPEYQHQNFAERKIGDVKRLSSSIMDRTGTPAAFWLLCLFYVVFLLNHMSSEALGGLTPIEEATGVKGDISPLLQFHWWEPVFYQADAVYPSQSREQSGRWVGVAETQGDLLTYLILTDDSKQVIARSNVRSALDPAHPNLRASDPLGDGEAVVKPTLFSASDLTGLDIDPPNLKLPHFSPDELLGLTFIRDMPDGSKHRASVARKIRDDDAANHQKIRFLIEIGTEGELDEIIAYNELSNIIEDQHNRELNDPDMHWTFKAITEHQGPISSSDARYKGSSYNVLVHWEDGSETFEPLSVMAKADPLTCALYAKDNDLLDTPGWKSLKRIANREVKFARMVKQAKLHQSRHGPTYKFGILVPKNRKDALAIDAANGNEKWKKSMDVEINQIDEYDTFNNLGKGRPPPRDHNKIRVHFVYDVKHDLRLKSRLVAEGNLTAPPKDSVYSGVVTLRSLRLCMLLAELNGLKVEAADIGNAYLEAYTQEKLYIIAGPEFGDRQGNVMVIVKALYGLRTSGARFHEKFADTLLAMQFLPCQADPDVWMKDCGTHYEYVCVYVDDLAVMMKDPSAFFAELRDRKYKLKGVGEITYHLGGDFYRDPDGTLAWGAKTYCKRIVNQCESIFGALPKEYTSPIDKDDHPELDTTEEAGPEDIKSYQSLIGSFQWAISLGRYDIYCATMSMGRFRAAPKVGHLKRLNRICGYLKKYPEGAIRFRTEIPDYSHLDHRTYDWAYSVYGDSKEEVPSDMPTPRGKPVRTSTFEDANLMQDLTTGRSVSGILHLVNSTPTDWYCKLQNSVETATYGSEFVAARLATEQIMDLRYTLRSLGAPLDGKAYMFGDNESVITSSTIPHSSLNKRHNALSYHRVREAIASNVLWFFHISGKTNPADVLTKFCGHSVFWPLVKPYLFWRGPTSKFPFETVESI